MKKEFVRSSWLKLIPDQNLDVHEDNLKLFWYWVNERQNIWHNRFVLKQDRPWTQDEILNDYNFTNVYRELDRTSIWIIDNVINSKDITTEEDRLFALIMTRVFNNPETFERTIIPKYFGFNPKLFYLMVQKKVHNKGLNPFTNAYCINSIAFAGLKKYHAYCEFVSMDIHKSIPDLLKLFKEEHKPEDVIEFVKRYRGVSDFVAYELYCDFDYWNGLMKHNQNDYVNIGPGCKYGLRLIFPSSSFEIEDSVAMIHHLKDNQEMYLTKYGYEFKYLNNKYGRLSLRDIEHSLCEFQKYFKMKYNVGKPSKRFIPVS